MKKKVNWGILGCAGIAERAFIPALGEVNNAELHGIAARDESRAKDWAKRFGFQKSYRNYGDLLKDPAIDAVYNPLPNNLHAEWSILAFRAGKHVLCEKPMAMNAGEVREMLTAAGEADVLLMEGFMYKFHPQIRRTVELVRSGELGEIRAVHSSFTFNRTFGRDNYRLVPGMGGGALYDVGCYTISLSRMIFDEEPLSAFARARIDPLTKVDTTVAGILEFAGDRFALFDCSFEAEFQSRLLVVGKDGTIALDRAFSAKDFDTQIESVKNGQKEKILVPRANMFSLMIEQFGRCILRREPLPFPPEDAERNMGVIDACFGSIRTGRPARIAS